MVHRIQVLLSSYYRPLWHKLEMPVRLTLPCMARMLAKPALEAADQRQHTPAVHADRFADDFWKGMLSSSPGVATGCVTAVVESAVIPSPALVTLDAHRCPVKEGFHSSAGLPPMEPS